MGVTYVVVDAHEEKQLLLSNRLIQNVQMALYLLSEQYTSVLHDAAFPIVSSMSELEGKVGSEATYTVAQFLRHAASLDKDMARILTDLADLFYVAAAAGSDVMWFSS